MKPRNLRLLVMHVSTRCDQACAHCSIWKGEGRASLELGVEDRARIIRDAHEDGARSILFTGGEPLLCDHLEALARLAHGLGLSVHIATNGLGLARAADWIGEVVDEIYISLDGPEPIHDRVRGTGMFARLRAACAALLARAKGPRLIGRSVVSSLNATSLVDTVAAARELGLDAISFLPFDATSAAFGGGVVARAPYRLREADERVLDTVITRLAAAGELRGFVLEDERKLRAIARSSREERTALQCDAPEWSSVVEADGAVRPCFFQPTVVAGSLASLRDVRRSHEYREALLRLGPGNQLCATCVCPKFQPTGPALIAARVSAILDRARPSRARGERSEA